MSHYDQQGNEAFDVVANRVYDRTVRRPELVIEYAYAATRKNYNAYRLAFNALGLPAPATEMELWTRFWTTYTSCAQAWPTAPYTGSSNVSSPESGFFPSVSGYDGGSIWFPLIDYGGFPDWIADSETYIHEASGGTYSNTLSGVIDNAGVYAFTLARFNSLPFDPFGSPAQGGFTLGFKDFNFQFGKDVSTLSASDYDGSDVIGGPSLLLSAFPGGVPVIFFVVGWGNNHGFTIQKTEARITGRNCSYFIARWREAGPAVSPLTGKVYRRIDLLSSGTVLKGQVVGMGRDIDVPFPSTTGWPLTLIGDSVVENDFTFVIFDKTPAEWAASLGYPFGDSVIP